MFSGEKIAEWCGGEWDGYVPACISGFSNNSRNLRDGELYVAIRGERFDGHRFAADAFEKGAAGALVERSAELDGLQPLLRVEDTVAALGAIAKGYRAEVGAEIAGVTGSVGKSTVKEMLASILSEAMPTARTLGNFNNEIGLPLSLLAMDASSEAGVFEVGMNHPGEIGPLCEILRPQWGIVTAVGPVHIEFFDSVEGIAREKGELLRSLPAEGHAVLCRDDPLFDVLRDCVGCTLLTVSLKGDADYRVGSDRKILSVYERSSAETVSFEWIWPGEHNALNAGYAIATGRGMGLGWDVVERGLKKYRPLAMRWDVADVGGVKVVNDAYNANPLSMRAALKSFAEMEVAGRKWPVLGGMMELGRSSDKEHLALGEFVAGGSWDGVVLVGELGRKIAEGIGGDDFYLCEDSSAAGRYLKDRVKEGDGILLKASRSVALEKVVDVLKTKKEEV